MIRLAGVGPIFHLLIMSSLLSPSQIAATQGVATFVSVLSFLGSLFIITCYFYFKNLRKFAFKLVAILSLTDLLNQGVDMFISVPASELEQINSGAIEVTGLCYAQAILNSYFELSSVLWTTAIAATVYMFVSQRMSTEAVEGRLKYFIAYCCGIPLLLAILPLTDKAYGASGAWCWIKSDKIAWTFVIFYIPLWLCWIINCAVYFRTYSILSRTIEASTATRVNVNQNDESVSANGAIPTAVAVVAPIDESETKLKRILNQLQWYPIVLICVWLFASINRVYEAANGGKQIFALFFLHKVMSSSQGLLNALVYGLSDGVKTAVWAKVIEYFPSLNRNNTSSGLSIPSSITSSSAAAAIAAQESSGKVGLTASGKEEEGEIDDADLLVKVAPSTAVAVKTSQAQVDNTRSERVSRLSGSSSSS